MKLGELGICNVLKCVVEPFVRVSLSDCTGSEEGVHHGSALSALLRAGKKIVFSAKRQRADFVLDGVIVDQQAPVLEQGH